MSKRRRGGNKRRWANYESYLASESWAAARKRALIYAEYRCQACDSGAGLEVHHRRYDVWGEERPADLTVLCDRCHGLFHEGAALDEYPSSVIVPVETRPSSELEEVELGDLGDAEFAELVWEKSHLAAVSQ